MSVKVDPKSGFPFFWPTLLHQHFHKYWIYFSAFTSIFMKWFLCLLKWIVVLGFSLPSLDCTFANITFIFVNIAAKLHDFLVIEFFHMKSMFSKWTHPKGAFYKNKMHFFHLKYLTVQFYCCHVVVKKGNVLNVWVNCQLSHLHFSLCSFAKN